jgi:hypothetical protein
MEMFIIEVGKNLMMQLKNIFCDSLYLNCLFRIMKNWEYGYQNLFFLLTVGKNYTQFFLHLLMREYIHNYMFLLSRLTSWNLSGAYFIISHRHDWILPGTTRLCCLPCRKQ